MIVLLIGIIAANFLNAQYSHAITIEKLLKTHSTEAGQHISYPHVSDEEVTIIKVTIPPGKSTGWHKLVPHICLCTARPAKYSNGE